MAAQRQVQRASVQRSWQISRIDRNPMWRFVIRDDPNGHDNAGAEIGPANGAHRLVHTKASCFGFNRSAVFSAGEQVGSEILPFITVVAQRVKPGSLGAIINMRQIEQVVTDFASSTMARSASGIGVVFKRRTTGFAAGGD